MISPLQLLKKYWNYESFREPQEAIIDAVLAKKDVVALLPTGGGKSICFQIPALLNDGVCIVISPLIALMQDQVTSLVAKGIKAVAVTSVLSQDEIINTFDNLLYGGYKFLYLSPEKLQSEFIQEKISQLNVNLIAVDEAHCISEWGHDFRPSYRNINILKQLHPNVNFITLTASATAKVLNDITENLELKNAQIFRKSLKRDLLAYQLKKTEDINYAVKQIVSKIKTPAIIYASNRKATKNMSAFLNFNGFKSTYYHGGLSHQEKQAAYTNWLSEKTPIIVATNAFGMGIDKNNVSTIIHINLPYSLENYMQEAGRAGRNNKKSSSVILYNESTVFEFKNQFTKEQVSLDFIKKIYQLLNQYFQISNGEKPKNTLTFSLGEFCEKYSLSIIKTSNAIKILDSEEIIKLDKSFNRKSTLEFCANHAEVLSYSSKNTSSNKIIKLILRSYGGVFENAKKIDEYILAKKLDTTSIKVINQLKKIKNDGLINYIPSTNDTFIKFLVPREDNRTINSIAKNIKQRIRIKLEKAKAVIKYIENSNQCRSVLLLSYFNEYNSEQCGICDVCLTNKNTKTINSNKLSNSILELIGEYQLISSRDIVNHLDVDKNSVLTSLQLLLTKNKIAITSQNKFQLIINE